jgi:4-hydroxy-tetrahydrodipicolinate reductase
VTEGNGGAHSPAFSAIRAGLIVGEHEVSFNGAGETIKITHSVTNRDVFARGAVQAALWLAQQEPGYYNMDDVLGIG